MRAISTSSLLLLLPLSCGLMLGQNQQISAIGSTYPVTIPMGVTSPLSTVELSVGYPVGLSPNQYISGTQLNTDFQGLFSAYPNPTDPPEAILSTVLQGILSKYSQITGGSLTGEISGPGTTIGGITIPGAPAGTITVVIGNYNPVTGLLGLLLKQGNSPKNAKPTTPQKVVPPIDRTSH